MDSTMDSVGVSILPIIVCPEIKNTALSGGGN
jgi:hypothetical protein